MSESSSINEQIRKAQDKMKRLEYENLILKLRIFLFDENCEELTPELLYKFSSVDDFKRYKNLIEENSELKIDVEQNDTIMQQASSCIEYLRKTYSEIGLKQKIEMDITTKYIRNLKARKANLRKKRASLILLPLNERKKIIHFKVRCTKKMKKLKKLLALKDSYIKNEDQSLCEFEDENLKLEMQNNQLKLIIDEQNNLIESLNKTIDIVKGNADDYKSKLESINTKILDEEIDLTKENKENQSIFPFHNPLFDCLDKFF
ncbi:hypothetical protein PVAND_010518 [Polypedilum vanderplanki]|uniref:Uncharacterized protein n=1 Tax=Polypedilum vanderplanki TaxID=319348 RepID=A0A9J6CG73_POLVA|nr:hypothetical protein PVAND_010518 [Polypedilum vanderplanki]